MRESKTNRLNRAKTVFESLLMEYPNAKCSLHYNSAHELLIATILSAQCTDHRVNQVTPALFKKYPSPKGFAYCDVIELAKDVHSCGYHNQKAKSIQGASRMIAEEHGGEVPRTMKELVKLPGVARKTANVVLGKSFGLAEGVVVDVHCSRLSARPGFTEQKDPKKIEQDLMDLYPKKDWIGVGQRFVLHGRYVCLARKPRCEKCPIAELCPERAATPEGKWKERAAKEQLVVMSRGEEKL